MVVNLMLSNNEENREKLADRVIENMNEEEIKLLAYKGLLEIYKNRPAVFQHDYNQEFPDVVDLSE